MAKKTHKATVATDFKFDGKLYKIGDTFVAKNAKRIEILINEKYLK